ncbi:MAG: hypothetical protein AAFO07_31230, partial [Bacteroidota bacterium]
LTVGTYPVDIVVTGLNSGNPITFADANADYTITSAEYNEATTVPVTTDYTLTSIADANTCSNDFDQEVTLTVRPLPQGEISLDFYRICDMEEVTLMFDLTVGEYPIEIVVDGLNDGNPISLVDENATYTITMDEYVLGNNVYTLQSITDNIGGDAECTTTGINQAITLLVELPTLIDAAAETYYIQPCEEETDFLYSILITNKCRTSLAEADEVEISGDAALVDALISKTVTNVNEYSFNVEFEFEEVPAGTHVITFSYEKSKEGRYSATTTITVEKLAEPNTEDLACNDNVNVTLDEYCTSPVTADMVLEGDNICNDLFTVVIDYGMGMKTVNEITECGQFKYEVYVNNGNVPITESNNDVKGEEDPRFVCWGYITGEDKNGPYYDGEILDITLPCTDIDTILKYSATDLQLKQAEGECFFEGKSWDLLEYEDAFFINQIKDNCTQFCHLDFQINDLLMQGDICLGGTMIVRTIRVTDEKGNSNDFIVRFIAEQLDLKFDELDQ